MKKLFKPIVFFISFLILGLSLLGCKYINYIFLEKTKSEGYLYIPSNASFKEVLRLTKPFLKDTKGFQWVAWKKKYPQLIRGGKYKIEKGWSNNQLINHLRSAEQEEIKVQIGQFETLDELAGKVSRQIEADSASIIHYLRQNKFLKDNHLTEENAKQLFLADTYYFYWSTSAKRFVERMEKEYHKFWTEKRIKQAKALNLSPLQVTTLAAIVEKETGKTDEQPKVARLYLNRLEHHRKLESDPTVIYAVKKKHSFDTIIKRVLYKHLKEKSPYNTYLNYGLPPAPISIASGTAIDAVLTAPDHNYMYMCASVDRIGYHVFSKTLAGHEINRQKYIKWLEKNQKK